MSNRPDADRAASVGHEGGWSPNQQAARQRIGQAASVLLSRDGLTACTIRAVAEEAGLPKSTLHYYVRDANDLVDLGMKAFLDELADATRVQMAASPDGVTALRCLVDTFMEADKRPRRLGDPTLWAAYTAHAWNRGERVLLAGAFDTFTALFVEALERCEVDGAADRGLSVYLYLLGAVQRNIAIPVPSEAVLGAVSRLSGVDLGGPAVRRGRSPRGRVPGSAARTRRG